MLRKNIKQQACGTTQWSRYCYCKNSYDWKGLIEIHSFLTGWPFQHAEVVHQNSFKRQKQVLNWGLQINRVLFSRVHPFVPCWWKMGSFFKWKASGHAEGSYTHYWLYCSHPSKTRKRCIHNPSKAEVDPVHHLASQHWSLAQLETFQDAGMLQNLPHHTGCRETRCVLSLPGHPDPQKCFERTVKQHTTASFPTSSSSFWTSWLRDHKGCVLVKTVPPVSPWASPPRCVLSSCRGR